MADISYVPTFRHVLWQDRRDRVGAAGPNGCNGRFNAIASDLRLLSRVVGDIGAAIDASNAPPAPRPRRLSFTPVLRTTASSTGEWSYDAEGTAATFGGEAIGVANLTLPDGFRLSSARVVGSLSTNSFGAGGGSISLLRTPLRLVVPPPAPEVVGEVQSLPFRGAFDTQMALTASRTLIDTSVFRYFFLASHITITFGGMSIAALDLTFVPSP
ncbi:hypothetical protein ABZT17_35110 [Streptomyces sp. NPDC005648]|uniref:hypothetical protein n=1 Tax=Streptomyces sp. NPDC005648 TaxID=3157044 RepID=UPI0033B8EF7C